MPTSRMHARTIPPVDGQRSLLVWLRAEVASVVFTVSVVVCAVEPLIETDTGMLHEAGSLAAVGAIAQLRLIVPVNPPEGVKVMVEVFPVVAPGIRLIAVPVTAKLGEMLMV